MSSEYSAHRKSQLRQYLKCLCVKCGSCQQENICAGCGNQWAELTDEEYKEVLNTLEHKFEVDVDLIKIPDHFREIDPDDPQDVRAKDIAKFIKLNKIY